jgi:hypothetical protein
MTTTEVAQESKTFFAVPPHYVACVNPGKAVLEGGIKATFGEKYLEFSPTSGPDKKTYGVITTDDPEKIAWLEKEIARGNDDLMTPEQFYDRTTPSEVKIRALRNEQEAAQRKLGVQNQILADLQSANPELYNKLVKSKK